jgi:hypothetical protein
MISGNIVVVRGKAAEAEEWGEFEFLALPSPGDRLMVERDGEENYATVLAVHHTPRPSGSNRAPTVEVVAKWTGAAARLR